MVEVRFDRLSDDGASDVGHVLIRLLIEAKPFAEEDRGKTCRPRPSRAAFIAYVQKRQEKKLGMYSLAFCDHCMGAGFDPSYCT